ncbi:hypothetical protein CYMTET_56717 [Cymbomonas tetramitiformis]|uniref:Peptidase S8/S53 domain-containing protein n=1 Tax=Cymbomonas tetramitiformis TaxID=36881 RepID=A0AAE0ENH1_9CHLO|nr:hypothetical protein CYMTET_56717 [Cymbomonas tetramitiformis]
MQLARLGLYLFTNIVVFNHGVAVQPDTAFDASLRLQRLGPPRLLVELHKTDGTQRRRSLLETGASIPGAKVLFTGNQSGVEVFEVPNEVDVAKVTEKLLSMPDVKHVEVDHPVHAVDVPFNDERWSELWGLQKIALSAADDRGGLQGAWATTLGSKEVVVAVVDTGVDYSHPDLSSNMYVHYSTTASDPARLHRTMCIALLPSGLAQSVLLCVPLHPVALPRYLFASSGIVNQI